MMSFVWLFRHSLSIRLYPLHLQLRCFEGLSRVTIVIDSDRERLINAKYVCLFRLKADASIYEKHRWLSNISQKIHVMWNPVFSTRFLNFRMKFGNFFFSFESIKNEPCTMFLNESHLFRSNKRLLLAINCSVKLILKAKNSCMCTNSSVIDLQVRKKENIRCERGDIFVTNSHQMEGDKIIQTERHRDQELILSSSNNNDFKNGWTL